jgi:hypothetical protein
MNYLCGMIHRHIESKIKSLIGKYPVISITGPRQSGKTTLVKSTFPEFHYVNCENLDIREFARSDPRGFINAFGHKLIIDEAQQIPDIFSYIQVDVDENKNKQYILTGSQNFLLLETISQSLAGRVALFYLLPFSFYELRKTRYDLDDYQSLMIRGGYPVICDKGLDPSEWLQNYLTTYIERDVRQVMNVGSLTNFQRFVGLCAGRIGQLINFSSIANDLSVSYHTIQSWLSILEASFITYRLSPYYRNYNKRLVKSPKLYFYDTGLACAILGIRDTTQLQMHYLKGELFENFILSEFLKYKHNNKVQINLFYWRDNSGKEIDCIMEDGPDIRAIEIKSAMTIHQDFFHTLHYWEKLSECRNLHLIFGGSDHYHRTNVQVLGWRDYELLFKK